MVTRHKVLFKKKKALMRRTKKKKKVRRCTYTKDDLKKKRRLGKKTRCLMELYSLVLFYPFRTFAN
jgi:RNase P/RNase MRP subunit p30